MAGGATGMKCLRCGYCCKMLAVIIVDDPKKGPREDNLVEHMSCDGTPCKHLRGEGPGKYSCALHDYSWYEETPCARHEQIGRKEAPCRMGEYLLGKEK